MITQKLKFHPHAFETAAEGDSPSIEGARLMLVEGLTCTAAAAKVGISHQSVNRAMARIRDRMFAGPICACCGREK